MSTPISDLLAERRARDAAKRSSDPVPTYTAMLLENMSIGELVQRLRGTDLYISNSATEDGRPFIIRRKPGAA